MRHGTRGGQGLDRPCGPVNVRAHAVATWRAQIGWRQPPCRGMRGALWMARFGFWTHLGLAPCVRAQPLLDLGARNLRFLLRLRYFIVVINWELSTIFGTFWMLVSTRVGASSLLHHSRSFLEHLLHHFPSLASSKLIAISGSFVDESSRASTRQIT